MVCIFFIVIITSIFIWNLEYIVEYKFEGKIQGFLLQIVIVFSIGRFGNKSKLTPKGPQNPKFWVR